MTHLLNLSRGMCSGRRRELVMRPNAQRIKGAYYENKLLKPCMLI